MSEPQDDKSKDASNQGRDPNTEGEDTLAGEHPKMSGTGEPGSHSAVFGLTPDGKPNTDTKSGTTPLKPAHSKDTSNTSSEDTGSRAGGAGVADQMDNPKVTEKGHDGDAMTTSADPNGKPGGGGSMTTPSQGTGEV